MQISSIPLGYANQELMDAIKQEDVLKFVVSRSSMGMFPPTKLTSLLEKPMQIRPPGMDHIQTLMCGACAVENALKAAFTWQAWRERNGEGPSKLELDSCMDGILPGSTNRAILGYKGSFHGRTFGSMSITNSKAAIKVDLPAFEWPHAPFPDLKYPLHENLKENEIEENKCLEETEDILNKWAKNGRPIAAIIIEPIQGEGGDKAASDNFFKKLGDLCKKYNSVYIVDEVQTGFGATGKWWASEYWKTPNGDQVEADILVYAKKSQACGFYYNKKFAPDPNGAIFNTWMGEPLKLVMMNKIIDIVKRDALLDNVNSVGQFLHQGFLELEQETNGLVNSSRGRGLYRAFNMDTTENRDKIVAECFKNGAIVGGCGINAVRVRPSLNFSHSEAEQLLDILRKSLKNF